jgi:hypothetical protein
MRLTHCARQIAPKNGRALSRRPKRNAFRQAANCSPAGVSDTIYYNL